MRRKSPRLVVRSGLSSFTYAQKVELGICVRCHATRMPEEPHARCEDCLEVLRKQHRRHYERGGGRAGHARYYRKHRPDILKAAADRRVQKKVDGICSDCAAPCRQDAGRCNYCSDRVSESSAAAWVAAKADRQRWRAFCEQWAAFGRMRRVRDGRWLLQVDVPAKVALEAWPRVLLDAWEGLV